MVSFLKRHRILSLLTALCVFFVWSLPAWLGSVWPLFSTKTIPEWVAERRWPSMTPDFSFQLTAAIGIGILVLLGLILFRIHQQKREEEAYEEIRKELETTRAKLSTLESKQPYLKTEPFFVKRKAGFGQSGVHHFRDYLGYFMLLRVTNEPTSLNSQAKAHHIYATISYCDKQWNEFFPSVHGGWFSLWQSHGSQTIGPPNSTPDSLDPHESACLGIALSYESDPQLRLYALDRSSGEWPNWFNPDLALPRETIYIKVIVGGNGFQRTYGYILSHHGVQLSPIDLPLLS